MPLAYELILTKNKFQIFFANTMKNNNTLVIKPPFNHKLDCGFNLEDLQIVGSIGIQPNHQPLPTRVYESYGTFHYHCFW